MAHDSASTTPATQERAATTASTQEETEEEKEEEEGEVTMAEIPSFFNRLDFMSILLPGYVAVVAYLILFRPELLFSEKTMSFDIFSSVVFVVTGPAFGLTLQQINRGLWAIYERVLRRGKEDRKFLRNSAKIRLKMTAEEKLELDETISTYDFCLSTAMALLFLWVYSLVILRLPLWAYQPLVLLAGGAILIASGRVQWLDSYGPTIDQLQKKYCQA